MGDLFKVISGGFARFVLAWMLPTLISVGLFSIVLLTDPKSKVVLAPVATLLDANKVVGGLILVFIVLTISVFFAYGSVAIYRVLEGYTLPRRLRLTLTRRHRRRFVRLRELDRRWRATGILPTGLNLDALRAYPEDLQSVRATRLGNALTGMESWSRNRYHLDSQTMWFELLGVASEEVRKNTEETRAPVDFFVSSIANAVLLALVSGSIAAATGSPRAWLVAAGASMSLPVSYHLAVKNVLDWTQAVKAMVNLSRRDLAAKLGVRVDSTLRLERDMWTAHYYAIEANHRTRESLYDYFRIPPVPPNPTS